MRNKRHGVGDPDISLHNKYDGDTVRMREKKGGRRGANRKVMRDRIQAKRRDISTKKCLGSRSEGVEGKKYRERQKNRKQGSMERRELPLF